MSTLDKYVTRTPTSKKLYERAVKVLPSGSTNWVWYYWPYPFYAKRAKGSRIWDVDGNEYIDCVFNSATLIMGHNHPKVRAAVLEQLECGTGLGRPTELEITLAEKIRERLPCAEMVRYTATGTEACMNAIRLARAYTGKNKIAMFEGAYQGTSDSVTTSYVGLPQAVKDNTLIMPFNDLEAVRKIVKESKEDLAAVFVEPVQHSIILPKEGFLKGLREITEENDVLLMFDEMVTGFRLGRGGAQEYFNVIPDIAVVGKAISGGCPIGVITGKKEVMKMFEYTLPSAPEQMDTPIPSGGTYFAHPLPLAMGIAILDELTPEVYEHMDMRRKEICDGLIKLSRDLKIKTQVYGIASLFRIYFVDRELTDTKTAMLYSDNRLRWYFDVDLLSRGVYLYRRYYGALSAATSKEDVRKTLEAMEQTLKTLVPVAREISPKLIET